MKHIILLSLVFILSSCDDFVTFEDVSKPYLSQYGSGYEELKSSGDDFDLVMWTWYDQGFSVSFSMLWYSGKGWEVSSTYKFEPIL